jgi:hypothetical protein
LQGSVVQRLQRFATYTHLKQVVLRMITEDMRQRGKAPSFSTALQVSGTAVQLGCAAAALAWLAVGAVGTAIQ